MLQFIMSSSTKRAFFYLANSSLHSNALYNRNYIVCFSSASNKLQNGDIIGGDTRVSVNSKKRLEKNSRSRVVAEDAVEIAKAGVVGAVEVGLKFGEMTKQIGDGLWDAAKKTAESVIHDNQIPHKHNITQTDFDLKDDFKRT